jgi:hypothetical protein
MNQLGLELQEDGLHQAALETLKLNVLLFPTSFNVYDSYAEVLSRTVIKRRRSPCTAVLWRSTRTTKAARLHCSG